MNEVRRKIVDCEDVRKDDRWWMTDDRKFFCDSVIIETVIDHLSTVI